MGRNKGPEWDQVTIIEPEGPNKRTQCKVRCKHCLLEFFAGATRIREHFVYSKPSCGVSKCTKVPAEVLELMQREHDKKVQEEQKEAQKRALDLATSSTAAAAAGSSKKQRTLGECVRGVSKAECDEAVARLVYAEGLPLSLTESPYFKDLMTKVKLFSCAFGR